MLLFPNPAGVDSPPLSRPGVQGKYTFSLGNQILHISYFKKGSSETHGEALTSLQTVRYQH